jgi:hypothetical protein
MISLHFLSFALGRSLAAFCDLFVLPASLIVCYSNAWLGFESVLALFLPYVNLIAFPLCCMASSLFFFTLSLSYSFF